MSVLSMQTSNIILYYENLILMDGKLPTGFYTISRSVIEATSCRSTEQAKCFAIHIYVIL